MYNTQFDNLIEMCRHEISLILSISVIFLLTIAFIIWNTRVFSTPMHRWLLLYLAKLFIFVCWFHCSWTSILCSFRASLAFTGSMPLLGDVSSHCDIIIQVSSTTVLTCNINVDFSISFLKLNSKHFFLLRPGLVGLNLFSTNFWMFWSFDAL